MKPGVELVFWLRLHFAHFKEYRPILGKHQLVNIMEMLSLKKAVSQNNLGLKKNYEIKKVQKC